MYRLASALNLQIRRCWTRSANRLRAPSRGRVKKYRTHHVAKCATRFLSHWSVSTAYEHRFRMAFNLASAPSVFATAVALTLFASLPVAKADEAGFTDEQLEALQAFRAGSWNLQIVDAEARSSHAVSVVSAFPAVMSLNDWDPRLDELREEIAEHDLRDALGTPFLARDGLEKRESAKFGAAGTYGQFEGFRYLRYPVLCQSEVPRLDECIFLEFILTRDRVVYVHQVAD